MQESDFHMLRVLGRGGFGAVKGTHAAARVGGGSGYGKQRRLLCVVCWMVGVAAPCTWRFLAAELDVLSLVRSHSVQKGRHGKVVRHQDHVEEAHHRAQGRGLGEKRTRHSQGCIVTVCGSS